MNENTTTKTEITLKDLQVRKLQNEIELQEIDKLLKKKELRKNALLQPTTVTLLVAIIGLFGAGISNILQRKNQLEIEDKKFQYSIYQRALEVNDDTTAARALDFYIKAGLLPGEEGKYMKLIQEGKGNEVPINNPFPEGATAECKDGSFSFSQTRPGTCEHHGGVKRWLK